MTTEEEYQADKQELREDQEARDTKRKKRSRNQLGAYLLIVALGFMGFLQVQKANEATERAASVSAYELCIAINENREVLSTLINSSEVIAIPPNADQGLVTVIEEANKRNAKFKVDSGKLLAPKQCPPTPYDS